MPRVGFYPRAAALLIDLAIFVVIGHFLTLVDFCINEFGDFNNFGLISLGGGSLFLIAYSLLDVISAGTLGKKYLRLAIASQDGSAASKRNLAERWLYKHLPVMVMLTAFGLFAVVYGNTPIGYDNYYTEVGLETLACGDALLAIVLTIFIMAGCFAAMTPAAQAFHDRMANTAVFSTRHLHAVNLFEPLVAQRQQDPPQYP